MRSSEEPGERKMVRIDQQPSRYMWASGSRTEPDGSWPRERVQNTAGFGTPTSWLGTPISVRPQPYWIPPWKCLFLSPSHGDTSRPLISSLFIKEFPEESAPGLWLEGPWSQEEEAEGRICSSRNIIFFTWGPDSSRWCENLPRTPQCCLIATQKVPFNFLFSAQFGSYPLLSLGRLIRWGLIADRSWESHRVRTVRRSVTVFTPVASPFHVLLSCQCSDIVRIAMNTALTVSPSSCASSTSERNVGGCSKFWQVYFHCRNFTHCQRYRMRTT